MVSLVATVLALGAAFAWALNSILVRRGTAAAVTSLGAAFSMAIYGMTLPWTIHLGGCAFDQWMCGTDLVGIAFFALSGVAGAGLGRFLSYEGVRTLGAGVHTTAISVRPVIAATFAFVLLRETPSTLTLLGVALILLGLMLLPLSGGGDVHGWKVRYLAFPLAAATLFATADVIRRGGLGITDTPLFLAASIHETTGVLTLATMWWFSKERREGSARPRGGGLAVAALGATASQVLVFGALAYGTVALTTSLVSTSPAWTTLMAAFLLRETDRITWLSVVALVSCVLGAIVVVFS